MAFASPRLDNGLRVVTDAMAGVETASLGVWVGVGTRHEPAAINGVAHLLEHMAFKGTRAPLRPRHRRGDRGCRRPPQRLHLAREHRLLRPRADRRRGAGARHPGRHPAALDVRRERAGSASARSSCRRSARPTTRPTTSSSITSRRRAYPDQPLGRPVLGTRRDRRQPCRARPIRGYHARSTTAATDMVLCGGRQGRARRSIVELAAKRLRRRCRAQRPAPTRAGALCRRRLPRGARARAGASRARLPRHRLSRSRLLRRSPSIRRCWAAACRRACSRRSARSAGWSTASTASRRL